MHFGKNRVDKRNSINKRDLKRQLDTTKQEHETNFNPQLRESMWSLSMTWMRDYISKKPAQGPDFFSIRCV